MGLILCLLNIVSKKIIFFPQKMMSNLNSWWDSKNLLKRFEKLVEEIRKTCWRDSKNLLKRFEKLVEEIRTCAKFHSKLFASTSKGPEKMSWSLAPNSEAKNALFGLRGFFSSKICLYPIFPTRVPQ